MPHVRHHNPRGNRNDVDAWNLQYYSVLYYRTCSEGVLFVTACRVRSILLLWSKTSSSWIEWRTLWSREKLFWGKTAKEEARIWDMALYAAHYDENESTPGQKKTRRKWRRFQPVSSGLPFFSFDRRLWRRKIPRSENREPSHCTKPRRHCS